MAPRNSKPRVLFLEPATKYDFTKFNRTNKKKIRIWPRGDLNSGPHDYQSCAPPDYATGPFFVGLQNNTRKPISTSTNETAARVCYIAVIQKKKNCFINITV